MKLKPTDDHIFLEATEDVSHLMVNGIWRPNVNQTEKVSAKVISCGPGDLNQQGQRNPMPCKAGDTVIVSMGAGFRLKHEGTDYWVVYGGRKDIIAVVGE